MLQSARRSGAAASAQLWTVAGLEPAAALATYWPIFTLPSPHSISRYFPCYHRGLRSSNAAAAREVAPRSKQSTPSGRKGAQLGWQRKPRQGKGVSNQESSTVIGSGLWHSGSGERDAWSSVLFDQHLADVEDPSDEGPLDEDPSDEFSTTSERNSGSSSRTAPDSSEDGDIPLRTEQSSTSGAESATSPSAVAEAANRDKQRAQHRSSSPQTNSQELLDGKERSPVVHRSLYKITAEFVVRPFPVLNLMTPA